MIVPETVEQAQRLAHQLRRIAGYWGKSRRELLHAARTQEESYWGWLAESVGVPEPTPRVKLLVLDELQEDALRERTYVSQLRSAAP